MDLKYKAGSSNKRGKVFYGWWIVLISAILSIYGDGIFYYGFSTFVKPIVEELAWSMAVVSGAFSMYRLETAMVAPVVGYLLDRIGPQKLVFAGGLVMGGGFILLSQVHTVLSFYAFVITISFGCSGFSGAAFCSPMVGKWFVRKRGRAIGIQVAACGLAGLIVPVVAHSVVYFGWRGTLLLLGLLTWFIVLPLSFFLRHSPEQYGLLPDGDSRGHDVHDTCHEGGQAKAFEKSDFSLGEAMKTSVFWILTVCLFAHQMTQAAIFVHLIPYLIDKGIEATSASSVVTFIVLASIAGRYGLGWLSDRFNPKWLLIFLFTIQPIGLFLLIKMNRLVDVIPFVLLYSIAYGGALSVKAIITGDYFGRQNYGTIFGVIHGVSTFGSIAGPIIAGIVYDIEGSYYLAFAFFAIMMFLTAFLTMFLKRPICVRN